MKTIITKYHGPTDVKGSKIIADDGDGNRITAHYDSALDSDENHANACKALCKKMGWSGKLQGGSLLKGGGTVGMTWVWIDRDCQVSV